ncbi:MAG TPA: PD-(D/E)XK nuclease family protein [Caldisericia bacterium]|nr:PD-(D/E)XK nuclease family protein [Caldisericia bacterium]
MKHLYVNQNKEPVPSVTTVISQLDKPYLLKWANSIGLKGYSYEDIRDKAAETGTIAHTMVENLIKGQEEDFSYHPLFVPAQRSFKAFQEWLTTHDIQFLGSEISLVNPTLGFGGTVDIIARIDGQICIIDIKTSNQLCIEYHYQVAAYALLLESASLNDLGETRTFPTYTPEYALLLRLDKRNGSFQEKWLHRKDLQLSQKVFTSLLSLFRLRENYQNAVLLQDKL